MEKIKDLAATTPRAWGDIAGKIDDNFAELEGMLGSGTTPDKEFSDADCRAAFLSAMNAKAAEIGMGNTTFYDPTGRTNVSTAHDMCRCLLHATGYDRLQEIWSKPTHKMTFIKEDGTIRHSTITHGLINDSFDGSYNPMGGKGGSLNKGRVIDGTTLTGYVSNMSCILQSKKNPDDFYAITTMGYYPVQDTAYAQKIQAIKDIMDIIEEGGGIVIDDSALDEVVYEDKTFRDIFVRNNLAPNINGGTYSKSVNGSYKYALNSAAIDTPSIVTDETMENNYLPPYSFKVDSSKSLNITTASNPATPGGTYFAAASVKITRYSAGRLGLTVGTNMNVALERVTDGYEVVSAIAVPAGSSSNKLTFYLGSSNNANLAGFINNPVLVNLSIFSVVPSNDTMTSLYNRYIEIMRDIYTQNGAAIGQVSPNADYICAFKVPKYNARAFQNIDLVPVYSKNPHTQFFPASMSKMMTAMVTLDFIPDIYEKVTLEQSDIDAFPTSNWYTKDILLRETMTIKDVLYIMMMPSSNIATEILSRVVGGKILKSKNL